MFANRWNAEPVLTDYVLATDSVLVYVDYRLAPEFTHPTASNDCYDCLKVGIPHPCHLVRARACGDVPRGSGAGGSVRRQRRRTDRLRHRADGAGGVPSQPVPTTGADLPGDGVTCYPRRGIHLGGAEPDLREHVGIPVQGGGDHGGMVLREGGERAESGGVSGVYRGLLWLPRDGHVHERVRCAAHSRADSV